MSKEWLEDWLKDKKEQLKSATVFINENGNEAVEVSLSVLNKLLENHLKLYDFWYRTAYEQNKRYREALEFYADEEHYKEKLISEAQYDADGICISNDKYAPPIIYFDSGEIARHALEGEE